MPSTSVTQHDSMDLGYPHVSVIDISIVGLQLKIYGLEEIKGSNLPVAAVILTHGRGGKEAHTAPQVHGMLGEINHLGEGKKRKRDVIGVTLEQRNHGARMVDPKANLSFDENPHHLTDMAAFIYGGAQDVSLIITFLECYLFPRGERVIDEWIATGHSLGGNVTWRLLRDEPRINITIPVVGLPVEAHLNYLSDRAKRMGFTVEPPIYPPSLNRVLEAPIPKDCYIGKKILSIHGEVDPVVPYSGGEAEIKNVIDSVGPDGACEIIIQPGVGHEKTQYMVRRLAEWIYRWAVAA